MKFIANALSHLREYQSLLCAIGQNNLPAAVTGLSSIHKANLIYSLWMHTGRRAFVLVGDEPEANRMVSDLSSQGMHAFYYPMRDMVLHKGEAASSHDYERQRLQVLSRLQAGECDAVVCCIDGALQYTIPPDEMKKHTHRIASGDTFAPEKVEALLLCCGYERAVQVEGPGQFARRGGILDIFPPESSMPV
ncbi:MAG TPA: transcription-repair coupling factor, partial [Ruminococcaceae bacterium]|nr:transcription-repair coupling factor [Oscillospiraceae bacterium]